MDFLELLKNSKSILLSQRVSNWQEAIRICGQILVERGFVTSHYVDKVIEFTKNHGPYYIICDGVALPHCDSREDIIQDSLSLVTLDEPIFFEKDSRSVRILIMLAIKEGETHSRFILPQMVAIFEENENINKILGAQNVQEIFEIISKINYRKYLS